MTKELANIQAEIAKELAKLQDNVGTENRSIKTAGSVFTMPDGEVFDGPIDLVIVDYAVRHGYYKGRYDPSNIVQPDCFALGDNPNTMSPHPNSPDPQHDNCKDCPLNQFGSNGPGKACKNTRLAAVIAPDKTEEKDLHTLSFSPTASGKFDGHIRGVMAQYKTPPIGVITEVNFDKTKTFATLLCNYADDNPLIEKHWALKQKAAEMTRFVYEQKEETGGIKRRK